MELRKFLSPEVLIGEGALAVAGQYAGNFSCQRALLVTDPGVINAGWTAVVEQSLQKHNIHYTLFSDITSNPRDYEVMNGAEVYKREKCDIIIVVGGGSPMDCAKGIGIIVSNGGHINDYEGVDRIPVPIPPLICVPTTAGSAADISQFTIINNTVEKRKITIISKALVPDVSLIDARVTTTKDNYLTACTAIDTLVHGIEAYVSNGNSRLSDLNALEAIKLVYENLLLCLNSPQELKYREALVTATLMAGLAFSNASLGIVHAMAHSLGGQFDTFHGETIAILLENAIEYNFEYAEKRYVHIARALNIDTETLTPQEIKQSLVSTLHNFRCNAGLCQTTEKWHFTDNQINILAEKAMLDPCLATNPRPAEHNDIALLYEKAAKQ
ncbi:MAG: alcohol dehydrogenase [Marinilabiliales bacterium]|nr:MAG: alcohol dehydrogenase [Marinilabiliales bacterium]